MYMYIVLHHCYSVPTVSIAFTNLSTIADLVTFIADNSILEFHHCRQSTLPNGNLNIVAFIVLFTIVIIEYAKKAYLLKFTIVYMNYNFFF
jgi:hypothetical protein